MTNSLHKMRDREDDDMRRSAQIRARENQPMTLEEQISQLEALLPQLEADVEQAKSALVPVREEKARLDKIRVHAERRLDILKESIGALSELLNPNTTTGD